MTDTPTLRKTFSDAELAKLANDAESALTGITPGPWKSRGMPGFKSFVEAPEPPERRFGYNIEILGDDDNGYPTRERDVAFIAASRQMVPDLAAALRQLLEERQKGKDNALPVLRT